MKKLLKRLKNKKGFTLVEVMFGVLIAAMAGMIALGGLTAVARSYHDILVIAEGQNLMKAYVEALRSGFVSTDFDERMTVVTNDLDGVDFNCAYYNYIGHYAVDSEGVIVFQPVTYCVNPETGKLEIDTDAAAQASKQIISKKFASSFTATLEYHYTGGFPGLNEMENAFYATITVTSDASLHSLGDVPWSMEVSFCTIPINDD